VAVQGLELQHQGSQGRAELMRHDVEEVGLRLARALGLVFRQSDGVEHDGQLVPPAHDLRSQRGYVGLSGREIPLEDAPSLADRRPIGDARPQLGDHERLLDEVLCPVFEQSHSQCIVGLGGQHEDRHRVELGVRSDGRHELLAAQARHHHVGDYEIG